MSLSQVFISYAHQDQAAAEGVCSLLETNGILCWMASRDIRPGPVSWAASIVAANRESRVLVVLFSASANRSKQMARELERADRLGLSIVPLRLESVEPEGDLEYFLANLQWLDIPRGNKQEQQLVSAIQALIPASREGPAEQVEGEQTDSARKRNVYLCYRREDAPHGERLYDRLNQEFPGRVFCQTEVGALFALPGVIQDASALLAVIGKNWLSAQVAERTQSRYDPIRSMIAAALEAQVCVFPILVDGARMPAEDDLPPDIQTLAQRLAIEVTERDFFVRLAAQLKYILA